MIFIKYYISHFYIDCIKWYWDALSTSVCRHHMQRGCRTATERYSREDPQRPSISGHWGKGTYDSGDKKMSTVNSQGSGRCSPVGMF